MKTKRKRVSKKQAWKSFMETASRLMLDHAITCPKCGFKMCAVSVDKIPRYPGIVGCFNCGLEIPVRPEQGIYLNTYEMVVCTADKVARQ